MSLEFGEVLILPVQFYGRPQRLDHQDVELAVLVQALQDRFYDGPVDVVHETPESDRADAEAWFASDDYYEFSFRMCCENNGIDPVALRRGLSELTRLDLPYESPIDLVSERPTAGELLQLKKGAPVCSHGHLPSQDTVYVTRKRSGYALRCLECARERSRARAEEVRREKVAAQVELFG